MLAVQKKEGTVETVEWQHIDASGSSYIVTGSNGAVDITQNSELDPLGRDAGKKSSYIFSRPHRTGEDLTYPGFADAIGGDCVISGITAPRSLASGMLNSGFWFGTRAMGAALYLDARGEYHVINIDSSGCSRIRVNDSGPMRNDGERDGVIVINWI